MRSPLTGVVFTMELTHAWNTLLALVVASVSAYAVSVLILKRSVLTEKVARRGVHLTREYVTDPLEAYFAREVISPVVTLPLPASPVIVYGDQTLREVAMACARARVTSATVVERADPRHVLGLISVAEFLRARERDLHEEEHRERILALPFR